MSLTKRHLSVVPDPAYQRGDAVIEGIHIIRAKVRAEAKRELLAELAQHFIEKPGEIYQSFEVAEYLLARAGEYEGDAA